MVKPVLNAGAVDVFTGRTLNVEPLPSSTTAPGVGENGRYHIPSVAVAVPDGQITPSGFCKVMEFVSSKTPDEADDSLSGRIKDAIAKPLAKVVYGYDLLFYGLGQADRKTFGKIFEATDINKMTDSWKAWRPFAEWAVRYAAGGALALATYGVLKGGLPKAAQISGFVKKWGPFAGMGFLVDSKILSSPDNVLDLLKPTGLELSGKPRQVMRTAVMGAEMYAASRIIVHEYSQPVFAGDPVVGKAAGWTWMGAWLAYTTYWETAAMQERVLTSVYGQEPGAGFNPLNWKKQGMSPELIASNIGTWGGSAVGWGAILPLSRKMADVTWRFGEGIQSMMQGKGYVFGPEGPAARALAINRSPLRGGMIMQRVHAIARGVVPAFRWRSMLYAADFTFWGVWFSMLMGRMNQLGRDLPPEVQQGSTVRPLVNRILNVLTITPLKAGGAPVSNWEGYMAGMAVYYFPYEGCNEQAGALHYLAGREFDHFNGTDDPLDQSQSLLHIMHYLLGANAKRGKLTNYSQQEELALKLADLKVREGTLVLLSQFPGTLSPQDVDGLSERVEGLPQAVRRDIEDKTRDVSGDEWLAALPPDVQEKVVAAKARQKEVNGNNHK